jgi:phosphoglycerate dehydrogenase-like enzyme
MEIERASSGRCQVRYLDDPDKIAGIAAEVEIMAGHFQRRHIAQCPNLRWVQTAYAGVERVLGLAREREGLILTNGSGSFGEGISEFMILYVLMFQKNMRQFLEAGNRREWTRDFDNMRAITGAKVTVIGLGDLGGVLARKMHALGAVVTGVKRTRAAKPEYLAALYTAENLDEAIRDADIVALCLPSTDETEKIFFRERIYSLKQDAILLNAGRGTAIDQEALIDALREKRIFAGLDVTSPEPLPADSPLWEQERAIITPHISAFATVAYAQRFMAGLLSRNLAAYLDGRPLENVVNLNRGY